MTSKRVSNIPAKFRKLVRNDLDELAELIKKARVDQQITQEQLASNTNLAITTIQAIENGRRFPSLPTLLFILRQLGIHPQFKRVRS